MNDLNEKVKRLDRLTFFLFQPTGSEYGPTTDIAHQ